MSGEDDKKKTEDLLKKSRQILEQAKQDQTAPKKSTLGGPLDGIKAINEAGEKAKEGYVKAKRTWKDFFGYYKPLWEKITWPFRKAHALYKKLHAKTDAGVYKSKPAKVLARVGRGLLYLFTAATLSNVASWLVPNTVPVAGPVLDKTAEALNYTSFEPVWDGVRMAGWGWNYKSWGVHKDTVYLTNYEESRAEKASYTLSGTSVGDFEAGKPIGVDQALYYDLKPSLAHHIWSLTHKGHFHNPSMIIGPVISGESHPYVITHYGNAWRLPFVPAVRGHDDILDIQRLPDDFRKAAEHTPAKTGQSAPVQNSAATSQNKGLDKKITKDFNAGTTTKTAANDQVSAPAPKPQVKTQPN